MKELKDYSTSELTDELIKRGGIQAFYVEPYEDYKIVVGDKEYKAKGPAILIENID